ncbi:MAG: cysteine hydrolase [Thermoleophilia bacterium]
MAIKLDPRKTALIIQDLQNDVIMPNGAFTRDDPAPAEHAKKQNVVANVKAIASAARAAGVPVIHVWYVVEPGAPGLKLNAPLFQAISATKGVVRGTHGAAPVKGLEAKKGDHVVEKSRMNAFHGTNLDNLLRGFGTENVVITGAWTNFSIEHTARHAADAGYNAVVVTDGTSTIDDEWQNAALNYALTNIATMVPTSDVVAALSKGAPRAAAKPTAKAAAKPAAAKPAAKAPARRRPAAK